MSGTPTFSRAKRFTFFAKPHKSIFEGSETQHVKSNLTASVDGNFDIKADEVDFNRTIIKAPKNVMRTEKSTVGYAVLTATSPAQAVPLFRASPGDTVIEVVANLTASFGVSGAVQRTLLSVGDAGDVDGFTKQIGLGTPTGWQWSDAALNQQVKGEYIFNASPFYREHKTYTAATILNAVFTASNMWLASFGHGSIDIYIDVMSRG